MRIVFLSFLLCALGFAYPVLAADTKDCTDARSSADVMRCLNNQYSVSQKEMNRIFETLIAQNNGQRLVDIKDLQTRWIEYRDLECAQETLNLETESLKRLENLRCLNRLTQYRIEGLVNQLQNDQSFAAIGEAGGQPRWMNALASDFPDIYWRYGTRTSGDLDCDGKPEQMMVGLQIDSNTGDNIPVISVSENPLTGRPDSTIIKLLEPAETEAAEKTTCNVVDKIQYMEDGRPQKPVPAGSAAVADTACGHYVAVKALNCADRKIVWDGQFYALSR